MGDKAKLPSQSSKSFQYTRYERLALPQSTLTEGTTPSDTAMTITTVTAVAEQWGAVVTLSDVAELTIRHKPLQKAIMLLGVQAAETIDREIYKVVSAGTQVFFPGTVSIRSSLTATDVLTSDTLARIVATLRDNGAFGIDKPAEGAEDTELGDYYVAIVDSFVEQDIVSDPDFIDANKYAKAKRLWNGEAGSFKGFRFVRSNLIPTLTSAAAPTAATNATAGTYTNVSHRVVVTGVDNTFGYEKVIYQPASVTPLANQSLQVTLPATTGFTYNVYVTPTATSTDATTALQLSTGNAPSAVVVSSTPLTTGTLVPGALNSATSKVHQSFFIGKEAYTTVDLQALQATLTPPTASDSDPLIQRRKAGWKTMFKAVINNNNFFARCESESAFD